MSVRIYVDFQHGPMADPEAVLGGESMWADSLGGGRYRIDNLLFSTEKIGYGDVVQCADLGNGWDDRSVVALVEPHPCWRGLVQPLRNDPDCLRGIARSISDTFGKEDVQVEGGMGVLLIQCEPRVASALIKHLETHPNVLSYALEPINTQSPIGRN